MDSCVDLQTVPVSYGITVCSGFSQFEARNLWLETSTFTWILWLTSRQSCRKSAPRHPLDSNLKQSFWNKDLATGFMETECTPWTQDEKGWRTKVFAHDTEKLCRKSQVTRGRQEELFQVKVGDPKSENCLVFRVFRLLPFVTTVLSFRQQHPDKTCAEQQDSSNVCTSRIRLKTKFEFKSLHSPTWQCLGPCIHSIWCLTVCTHLPLFPSDSRVASPF